jgi:SAM-dependent methyltransferase
LPFPDDSFDAVAATGVLEYVDTRRALDELARVLRPGGRAVVSYPNPDSIYGKWKVRVFYIAVRALKRALRRPGLAFPAGSGRIAPKRFATLLRDAGLSLEAVEYTSFLPLLSPLDQLLPRTAVRAGERLEGSGSRLGRRLATQVVYAARKPEATR